MQPLPFAEFVDRTPIGFPNRNRMSLNPIPLQREALRQWMADHLTPAEKEVLADLNEVAARYAGPSYAVALYAEHDQRALNYAIARFKAQGINPDTFVLMQVLHDDQMTMMRSGAKEA